MSLIEAQVSAVITAPADEVYAVFADYVDAHQHILPRPYFSDMIIEEGGQGAGTIFRTSVTVMGITNEFRMTVSEPVAGRSLRETDIASGLTTTFELEPVADGRHTQVTIGTRWQSKPGVAGLIERLTTPPIMRSIYRKEFRNLQEYLDRRQARHA